MVNLRFFDFSVIAIFLLFLHAGNSHAGSKTCDNQLDVCGKRIDLENDRCWASCEKRYEDDFDAKDRCTDRCIQTSELADKTCIRNYDQCESSVDSSPSPNPRSTLGAAQQRQAENRVRRHIECVIEGEAGSAGKTQNQASINEIGESCSGR